MGKRRGFVRTRVSQTETVISSILLLLLAGIGAGIYVKGQSYDPGLFTLDQSALSERRSEGVQPERLVYNEDEGSITSPGTDTDVPSPSALFEGLAPPGWKTLGDVEHFPADTLWEKINGRAEQYHDYNVVGLTSVSIVNEADDSRFIDVSVFDMGRPSQAFGVFSSERSRDISPISMGREGYREEASYFFWKGSYYVQVIVSDRGAKLEQAGLEVARNLEKRLADSGELVWGLEALPKKDQIPGTIQYYLKNALSLDFLKDTYIAMYHKGDSEIMAFLSKQPSPEIAAKILAAYESYMNDFGKVVGKRETDDVAMVTGDMGGIFDVVFRKGNLIGGVTSVKSLSIAEKGALDLIAGLQEAYTRRSPGIDY